MPENDESHASRAGKRKRVPGMRRRGLVVNVRRHLGRGVVVLYRVGTSKDKCVRPIRMIEVGPNPSAIFNQRRVHALDAIGLKFREFSFTYHSRTVTMQS